MFVDKVLGVKNKLKNSGFSLTEMLLAIGILSVGMVFIAGVFPVAIHFTTISTERTIAAVVADEAFAKIKLYADPECDGISNIDFGFLQLNNQVSFNDPNVFSGAINIAPGEFTYPSTDTDISQKHYCFSALCRLTAPNSRLVQVTVFISRKIGPILRYYAPNMTLMPSDPDYGKVVDFSGAITVDWPRPVKVVVVADLVKPNVIHIFRPQERKFINDGCRILDNAAGRIYRVMECYPPPDDDTILLDGDWQVGSENNVWVVPPPTGGGRYPCIAVYQKEIRF